MRLNIRVRADLIDIFYRHTVLSLIKEVLQQGDPIYKAEIYKQKLPKPFTFSVYFFNYHIKNNQSVFISKKYKVIDKVFVLNSGHFNINFSTSDKKFFDIFLKGLNIMISNRQSIAINNNNFLIESIRHIKERKIKTRYVFFKTLSPFIISKKAVNNPKEYINDITDKRLKAIRGYGLKQEISFISLDTKTKKIKHTLKGLRDGYGKPYIYLNAMSGKFVLKGDEDDLKTIYQAGFLNRASQGFGMLEVY